MRLLRLKSTTGDNTSQFTTNLSAPLVLNKNAKLSLKSLNMNGLTLQDIEFLEDTTITVNIDEDTFSAVDVEIQAGKYTKDGLVRMLTNNLNAQSISTTFFQSNTPVDGFEWRCSYSIDNKLLISYKRKDNNPRAVFQQTQNVTNPNNGFYRRGDNNNDDTAFILSQLPTNRGYSKTLITITGGTANTEFIAGITTIPGIQGRSTLPVSAYKFGVVSKFANGVNVLKLIKNGAIAETIGAGLNPSQYDEIEFKHNAGGFSVKLYQDGESVSLITFIGTINLYDNYYTGITLCTGGQGGEQYNFDNYYDSPFAELSDNRVIETVEVPQEQIKLLGLAPTPVSIVFSTYAGDLLGFTQDTGFSQFAVEGTFRGSQTIAFSAIQDCVVEILSLSQLESYDTQVGYRRPILYIFDTLGIDTSGSAFGNVDYPIYIDIGNMDKYLVSSMTVRITSNNQTFGVSGYTSLLLLIED